MATAAPHLRTNVYAEERVGRRYGMLVCLAVDKRTYRDGCTGPNIRYLFRCDCGRECRSWWSHIYRLMRDGTAHCGCSSPKMLRKKAKAESLAKATTRIEPVWKHAVLGCHLRLEEWGKLCGNTRERMRQRFRDKAPIEAIAPYPLAVERVRQDIERRLSQGRIAEMEAAQDIAALLKAAKEATALPKAYVSKFSAYDPVIRELHGKGFGPAAIQRWFAEKGIEFKYAAVANRMKKLGLRTREAE